MRSAKGQELHKQAEHTREAGEFEKSIDLAKQAISAYEADKDYLGQSDAFGTLSLGLRHKARTAKSSEERMQFLSEAKDAASEGIKIAEENNLAGDLARPYFNLAKVQEDMYDFTGAVESYRKSVEIFKTQNPKLHNRSGVLADMNIHLATCEYMAGDKSALDRALRAIEDLKVSDEKSVLKYNYDVWLSGGYMRIAEMLKEDNKELAKENLEEAKKIIDGNPDLKIRLEQWEELEKSFK
ncbi:MAG TPA: hypothetical protein VLE44_01310 [Candidatus Saccharimonadales bacterium]|nr:hypothetical protein [Candidatus Saccharimonadales bacterium]